MSSVHALSSVALLAGAWLASHASQAGPEPALPSASVEDEAVAGILARSCFECHGPAAPKARGGLRMGTRDDLLRGGTSGPALVPGEPDASALVQAVRYDDPLLSMPPDAPLPAADVAALEAWVERGAPWPTSLAAAAGAPELEPDLDPGAVRFFEERVRPVLVESCFECHGPDAVALPEVKGGLRMSGHAALVEGGLSGAALVPGDPDASRLIRAVRYDGDLKMPPTGRLPESVVRDLERWVELGAPWPGGSSTADAADGIDVAAGREHWAFRPVERPAVPDVARSASVRNPIDAFVQARLDEAGLEPNPPADARTLVRRATLDLTGLPPTFDEVEAFVAAYERDPEAAWDALLDELLADPAYGEHLGREWLDLVRFAQTNGYERDTEKVHLWRYRDYVIDALNADVPYDEFLREQLAGDELDEVTPRSLVATGFYHLGPWDDEPDDPEQAVYDGLDDVVRVIGEGMLGVTVSCARCHDHKFDPFPQKDYYRLLAFVRNVRPHEYPTYAPDSATLRLLDPSPAEARRWEEGREREREELQQELDELMASVRDRTGAPAGDEDAAMNKAERNRAFQLRTHMQRAADSYEGDHDWVMAAREHGPDPEPTRLLARGRPSTPREEVEPRFPEVLCASEAAARAEAWAPARARGSSGRRRALADWVASPANPLTARVMANRVWQHHFGRGLVPTPNDFGRAGEPPTHPELLDWLACEFVDGGWSLKRLHRLVMSSAAYRRSSAEDARAAAIDPGDVLLWRQRLRRLRAEEVRDAACVASGTLVEDRGGRGFFPLLSRGALAGQSRPGEGWGVSTTEARGRRAVYAYSKRNLPVPLLEVLDAANPSLPVGRRASTNIASQALTLLNGAFMNRKAEELARRVEHEAGPRPEDAVERAFELVLARRPTAAERDVALGYLADQTRAFAEAPARLRFQPRMPERVSIDFLKQLEGPDFLFGPRDGWTYVKGQWGNKYNLTKGVDPERGPAALCERARFRDGVLELGLVARRGTESFGLLVRSKPKAPFVIGVELRFLPEEGRVELVHHRRDDSAVLASAAAAFELERRHVVRMALEGERVRVWLDDAEEPILVAEDVPPLVAGTFGVRLVGGEVELDGVTVTAGDGILTVEPDDPGPPERRALESLCLTLLNLNEFLYVD